MIIKKLVSTMKKHKSILDYSIYALFFSYMVYLITKESNFLGTFSYVFILVLFGSLAFLNEYLKKLYEMSILLLSNNCQPIKALEIVERIERLDIFKAYKKPLIIFKLLVLRDLGNNENLLNYIKSLDMTKYKNSKDIILTYNYSLFITYINMGSDNEVNIYYKNLISMKKSNEYTPLFSWNEIIGMYHFYNKNYSESKKYYNKVSTSTMNNRERVYFLFNLSKLYLAMKNYDDAARYLKELAMNGNNISISSDAKKLLNSYNKEFK